MTVSCAQFAAARGNPRHHPFVDLILGLILLTATAIFVFLTFKGSMEYADDHWFTRPFWWLPLLAFLGGVKRRAAEDQMRIGLVVDCEGRSSKSAMADLAV